MIGVGTCVAAEPCGLGLAVLGTGFSTLSVGGGMTDVILGARRVSEKEAPTVSGPFDAAGRATGHERTGEFLDLLIGSVVTPSPGKLGKVSTKFEDISIYLRRGSNATQGAQLFDLIQKVSPSSSQQGSSNGPETQTRLRGIR